MKLSFLCKRKERNISKKNKNFSKFILQIHHQHHKLKHKKEKEKKKTYKISKFVEEKLALTLEV
jgi:hypothetical protein